MHQFAFCCRTLDGGGAFIKIGWTLSPLAGVGVGGAISIVAGVGNAGAAAATASSNFGGGEIVVDTAAGFGKFAASGTDTSGFLAASVGVLALSKLVPPGNMLLDVFVLNGGIDGSGVIVLEAEPGAIPAAGRTPLTGGTADGGVLVGLNVGVADRPDAGFVFHAEAFVWPGTVGKFAVAVGFGLAREGIVEFGLVVARPVGVCVLAQPMSPAASANPAPIRAAEIDMASPLRGGACSARVLRAGASALLPSQSGGTLATERIAVKGKW